MSGARDHAGHMDAIYKSQRHIYDLTRKYYLLGRDQLIRDLAPPNGGSVIEVGCGTARNLIAAAKAWPQARFFGFDISEEMLITARAKVAATGLSERITLRQGDATDFDPQALFGLDGADRVFMSYTLSMIPDWKGTIAHGAEVLAPGGQLHIVDFGQQERLPRAFKALLHAWLAKFDVEPRAELESVVRSVAAARQLTPAFAPLYRGYACSARLTRP